MLHETRRASLRTSIAALAALSLLLNPAAASAADNAGPAVQIADVGGQQVVDGKVSGPVSGEVDVTGSADTTQPAEPQPLVADAGDSPFVAVGDNAVLLGSGYGGAAPYEFAWSAEDGELADTDSSSTELDTTGLSTGTYPVTLTVTDSAGKSTSDTVLVAVYEQETAMLLETTHEDLVPGLTGVGQLEFRFDVVENTKRLDAKLSWTNELNDYDLFLEDPEGNEAASSAGGVPQTEEATGVAKPATGTWVLRVDRFLAATDTLTIEVEGTTASADPRPDVVAGGPYTFATGAEQALDGSVSGGADPVDTAWDLDGDGVFESDGTDITASLPEGRHLVTLKATGEDGLERRETTSVLVADPSVIATQTTPVTVIGVADTGINPYHLEFSAKTYPDPDVLELTEDFTRHPGEYIPGYPKGAKPLDITLDDGYFPEADSAIWDGNETINAGEMYWIPGTKIVGAVDAGGSTGATSGDDPHPILDDNGHGSGSASVSAGNRYGYCPTCLLVVVEALDETVVAELPWVDISTNSFGYVGGAPVGPLVDGSDVTRKAAERGQTTLFAAGNGVGNAFDAPVSTWHSDQTGPDWNITVGAIRRDNQRAIVGDGIPVHLSSWGDGNLPSACGKGTVGQCAFGGTSAATPYTAGVFGTTLTQVRAAVGDAAAGQKDGQAVAVGVPREDSVYLDDGELTRGELREAVLKSAMPLGKENTGAPFAYPLTAPYTGELNVLFEGYGAATPAAAERAVDVLLGRAQLPERPFEDEFFAFDRSVRDSLWGGFDRDGDGEAETEAVSSTSSTKLTGLGLELADVATAADTMAVLREVVEAKSAERPSSPAATSGEAMDYFLHRRAAGAPGSEGCAEGEQYMTTEDSDGDLEPCFEERITSVAAAYRPLGIFASEEKLDEPLAAGSTVNVELYVAGETPAMIRPSGTLVATDREIGKGEGTFSPVVGTGPGGAGCEAARDSCWSKYEFSFDTTRPAFSGEQLTFQVQLLGARSWAFGFEGEHASKISIDPAELPAPGLTFGTTIDSPADGSTMIEGESVVAGGSYEFPDLGEDPTGAGDHPVSGRVEVSIDDEPFRDPAEASLDEESGTWRLDAGELAPGDHVVYARAQMDATTSDVVASSFTIEPDAEVQWQVVHRNGAADPDAWQQADGIDDWSFRLDTGDYRKGPKMILVRVIREDVEVARDTVSVRFG
ncbi:MAG: S8 family serine peptidase [Actinophytocola sp.]|nr:S8 family serine peptidase [Actinophytocola sp.]